MAIYITTSDGTRRRFVPTGWDEELAVDAMRQSNERWLTMLATLLWEVVPQGKEADVRLRCSSVEIPREAADVDAALRLASTRVAR